MSIPSGSWAVQIGAIAAIALAAEVQFEPFMLVLSSTRKIVSNVLRNVYADSGSVGVFVDWCWCTDLPEIGLAE
jgi:hypothetical protein